MTIISKCASAVTQVPFIIADNLKFRRIEDNENKLSYYTKETIATLAKTTATVAVGIFAYKSTLNLTTCAFTVVWSIIKYIASECKITVITAVTLVAAKFLFNYCRDNSPSETVQEFRSEFHKLKQRASEAAYYIAEEVEKNFKEQLKKFS